MGGIGLGGSLFSLYHFSYWDAWKLPPWELICLIGICVVVRLTCRAERLRRLCLLVNGEVSFRDSLRINSVNDLLSALAPASFGSEVISGVLLKRQNMKLKQIAVALVARGIVDNLAIVLLVAMFGLWIFLGSKPIPIIDKFQDSLLLFVGLLVLLLVVLLAVLIGIIKRQKMDISWVSLFKRVDILVLTVLSQAVQLCLLPLIAYYVVPDVSVAMTSFWSYVLIYGANLLPLPSGGGAIELVFVEGLEPLLGSTEVIVALVWWRLAGHYLFVLIGGLYSIGPILRDNLVKVTKSYTAICSSTKDR